MEREIRREESKLISTVLSKDKLLFFVFMIFMKKPQKLYFSGSSIFWGYKFFIFCFVFGFGSDVLG